MRTQKNQILPTMPKDSEGQVSYNHDLQKKLNSTIRDIASDIEELKSSMDALEARVAALEP